MESWRESSEIFEAVLGCPDFEKLVFEPFGALGSISILETSMLVF